MTDEFHKSRIDVLSYQAGLESVKARLIVYKQNESILQENINMLKNEVEARDSVLVTLKQKLNQAKKEKDDLKLKFDKFQTSSQSLTELLASQKHDKQGLGYRSLENDSKSLSSSCPSDRLQPSGGYNAVPPPITGNFMPPKPDLVFNTAPIVAETDHSAFTVQLKDGSEPNDPQSVSSFVQTFEHVKSSGHSVQPIEAPIPAATPKPTNPKSNISGKRKNRKTFFVCKSVDHLIKDCDYHAKKDAQPTSRNYAHKGNHKKLVSVVVPKIMMTRPRLAHLTVTKSKSPIRRHITRSPSPKTSNSPPKVTAIKASVVSAAQAEVNAASVYGYYY
nr:hypothetical protein [Tanacetum cinerariifolium]